MYVTDHKTARGLVEKEDTQHAIQYFWLSVGFKGATLISALVSK